MRRILDQQQRLYCTFLQNKLYRQQTGGIQAFLRYRPLLFAMLQRRLSVALTHSSRPFVPCVQLTSSRHLSGKCKAYRLGDKHYSSKEECIYSIRCILHGYEVGQVIGPADQEDLMAVLDYHPRREEKVGCGIQNFTVALTEEGVYQQQTRYFVIVRTDGSREDFSYVKSLKAADSMGQRQFGSMGQPARNPASDAQRAMKQAVSDQVIHYRAQQLRQADEVGITLSCPLSGIPILSAEDCYVGYAPPDTFHALMMEWMTLEGLLFEDILLKEGDRQGRLELDDAELMTSWRDFHYCHASLQLLSKNKEGKASPQSMPRRLRNG